MITKFKIFENYDNDVDCDYCDTGYELLQNYYQDGLAGLYGKEEVEERVIDFCQDDFPIGLNNMPEVIVLYRLLNLENESEIRKNNLGIHFVGDKNMFDDKDFLYSASILSGNDSVRNWFIVTIETDIENINIESTLSNRAEYPYEYEYSLSSDSNLKITDIKQIDNDHYQ